MVLSYLAGGDKEKFCLDSLELLWIINSASSLAKENMYRHNEKCLQSKERKCSYCAWCGQDFALKIIGQVCGSISCSTVNV